MATCNPPIAELAPLDGRIRELFNDQHRRVFCWTDRLFAWLLGAQWIAATATALWISPQAWAGRSGTIHPHIYAALFLGLAIVAFPILLAIVRPGNFWTGGGGGGGAASHRRCPGVDVSPVDPFDRRADRNTFPRFRFAGFAGLLSRLARFWYAFRRPRGGRLSLDSGLVWPLSVYGTSLVTPWRFCRNVRAGSSSRTSS